MKAIVATIILTLGACAAQSAAAEEKSPATGPQTVVRYDDLDLAAPAGERILAARIEQAAQTVCGPAPDRLAQLQAVADRNRCLRVARASVQPAATQALAAARARSTTHVLVQAN